MNRFTNRDVSQSRGSRLAGFGLFLSFLGLLLGPGAWAAPADLEHGEAGVRWATQDGGFWESQHYVSGDYDGNGHTDVARVYGTGSGVTNVDVFRSSGIDFTSARWANGVGGFWGGQRYLAADFDGDGRDDIARIFGDAGSTTIDVLVSSGSSLHHTRWITRSGPFDQTMSWVVGDFNGDGRADVARIAADVFETSIDVFESDGQAFVTRRWATRDGIHAPGMQFVSGDFDGDGASDIAKVFAEQQEVSIDLYRSAGTAFSPSERVATRLGAWVTDSELHGGDWDGDGRADIALLDGLAKGLEATVFLSDGATFGRHSLFDAPTRSSRFSVGDYDGDGKTEVAGVDGRFGMADLEVYGGPTPPWEYDAQAVRWESEAGDFWNSQVYLAGDFDGDGAEDVARVFTDLGLTSIDVHRNTGAGFEHERWATRQGGHWSGQAFVAGDFDGDGTDDILKVFQDAGTTSVDIFLGGPAGFASQRWLTRQGGHSPGQRFVAGDFDGDGLADLAKIWENLGLANVDVYLSSGGGFSPFTTWASGAGGFWPEQQYVAGDYTGDGRSDIARIFRDGGLTSVDVFAAQGGSQFSEWRWVTREGVGGDSHKHVAGDFDGDGRDDLVKVGANAGGRVRMLIFTSHGAYFEGAHLLEEDTGFVAEMKAVAADFDHDGRAEVATTYRTVSSLGTHFDVYGGATLVDPRFLSSPGDGHRYDVEQVRANLADQGYSLVAESHLSAGQCTIVYPNADHEGDSKDMGVMACAYVGGAGDLIVEWNPVYGGCDVATSGGECEIGILDDSVTIDVGGVPLDLRVKGPTARACGEVSRDAVCAKTIATVWDSSFLITDSNGNGGGVGAFAGVAAGAATQYQGGVLSGNVGIGLGAGVRVRYSVDLQSAAEVGQAGFSYAQEGIDETIGASGYLIASIDDAAGEVFGTVGGALEGAVDEVCDWFGC